MFRVSWLRHKPRHLTSCLVTAVEVRLSRTWAHTSATHKSRCPHSHAMHSR